VDFIKPKLGTRIGLP